MLEKPLIQNSLILVNIKTVSKRINLTYLPIVSVNVVRSKNRLLKEISYEEKHQKISSKN